MKEKIKEFSKKYLLGFTLGLLSAGIVVVYAETCFPSNQTTYDNSSSGMSSTNVQSALDELYNVCKQTTADQIKDGLEKDPYECRYFFTGKTPNNYITFNNEEASWRIISAECDGTIKIVKDTSIGNNKWDNSGMFGNNNWITSSLNTYLNSTYYNNLNSTAKSQIVSHDWSIGIVAFEQSGLQDQVNDENATKWTGKIAILTSSEYLRTNSNNLCTTLLLYNNNYNKCATTTWAYRSFAWTLSPCVDSTEDDNFVIGSVSAGYASAHPNTNNAVHPALYLKSDLTLAGSGTKSDPYTIE